MTPARTLVPLSLVAPLAGVAIAGELLFWGLALGTDALDAGWYGRGSLLAAVHTLTLGTLAAAIVGIGWQVTTVIVASGWSPRAQRTIPWVNRAFLLGAAGTVIAIPSPGILGSIAATVAIGALLVRSALVLGMLVRDGVVRGGAAQGGGRPEARAWIATAEACLWVGLALAGALWAGRAGHPVFDNPLGILRLHVALLLGGWVGGWIVAAGSLLLPMFAVAREPPAWLSRAVLVGWIAGLLSGVGPLLAVAALGIGVLLGVPLLRGVRAGPALRQALLGCVGIAAAPLAGTPDAIVAIALLLGVLPILRGVAQRILPFLLWNHAFSRTPAPPGLLPRRGAAVQLGLSVAGAGLVVASRFGAPTAAAGAGLGLAGATLHAALLGTAWWRVRRASGEAAARVWNGG